MCMTNMNICIVSWNWYWSKVSIVEYKYDNMVNDVYKNVTKIQAYGFFGSYTHGWLAKYIPVSRNAHESGFIQSQEKFPLSQWACSGAYSYEIVWQRNTKWWKCKADVQIHKLLHTFHRFALGACDSQCEEYK